MVSRRLKATCCRQVPFPRLLLSVLLASLGLPPLDEAGAQRQRNEPEFTRQLLLIAPFAPDSGTELQLGRRVADGLRSRLNDILPGREVELARNDSVRARLMRAGFSPDSVRLMATAWQLGRSLRADEILVGAVASTPDGFRLTAEMALSRDMRLVQPLPVVEERTLGDAVGRMAQHVADARKQLVHHRRCENFMREARYADAMRSARAGIAEYRQGAIVRTCLTLALRHGGGTARDLLASAREVLAIDPGSAHALEAAGIALDMMQEREEAAEMWTRLFATDTASLELGERVVWALHENGNSPAAEPLILKLTAMHTSVTRLLHLQWRIANANRNWALAISTGEELLKRLPDMALDSAFVTRLAAVYETDGQRFRAIATAARGVADIPDAAQLYALYTRLVRTEADTVLPRGLALFPRSAELLAMNAEALRAEGRLVEALTALRHAVDLDPTLPQGELTVAQAEFDLGRPDSSLASLRRVVRRLRGEEAVSGTVAGEPSGTPVPDASVSSGGSLPGRPDEVVRDSMSAAASSLPPVQDEAARDSMLVVVSQFALSKGNTLLRAADATKRSDAFQLALQFLSLADSLAPTIQSRFLVGVAALGVANADISEAASASVGGGRCETLSGSQPMLQLARSSLQSGRDVAPDATDQYLAFLDRLDSFVTGQMSSVCSSVGGGTSGW